MRIFNTQFTISDLIALAPRSARALVSRQKILNAVAVIMSERRCSDHVDGLPFAVMVEPSAVCNMRCPVCVLDLGLTRTPPFLSMDVYTRIINELGKAMIFMNLWTWGEPLLNPHISEMISLASKKNILTALHTNGKNLCGNTAEQIVLNGLCYMVVSFDGATEETYGVVRGSENYDPVKNNISDFIKLRNSLGLTLPLVEFKMIVMRHNHHEIDSFESLGRQLGVDRITLRRLVLKHTPSSTDLAPQQSCYRLDETLTTRKNILHCNRPWRSSVILTSGDVVPCCVDSKSEHVMGNVNDSGGFAAIWNNDKYRAFRRKLVDDPLSIKICGDCHENSFCGDIFIERKRRL